MKLKNCSRWSGKERSRLISSGCCTCLTVHWRAVGRRGRKVTVWCAVVRVSSVFASVMWPTAMDDFTAWSWKKTLPPSSGQTVRISSLVIPRSSLPVSTPRVLTVLHETKGWILFHHSQTHFTAKQSHSRPSGFPHILEKPLRSSQALTCGDVEFMSRVTPPRVFCCEGEQRSWDDACEMCVVTQQSSGCHGHTGGSSTSPLLLIGSRTFCGTLPSSSRLLRTSHHCLDFWITCKNTTRAWVWTPRSSAWPQTTWTYFRGHI